MPLKTLAAALSPITLLNGLAAAAPVTTTPDIAYGRHERQQLDLYRPQRAGTYPVVVFIYGGGWEEGDRGMYRFVGAALAAAGIVTVIPDYRVFPEVRFPGFLEDAAGAVRWTREHAGRFDGDPDRMVLIGHSAGAHIAGMLAMDPQWLAAAGVDRRMLRGWVGLAGPYDFEPDTPNRRIIFGPDRQRTQPIGFARADVPPALLAAPRRDSVVDPANSTRLGQRITQAGGEATVRFYPRVGHASILGTFSPALRLLAPVFRDTRAFIESVTSVAKQREVQAA